MTVDAFFAYARERHAIYLRRAAGQPAPWTQDPVLQNQRFCNVYRELDRTTAWFRRHVRDPLRARPEVLLATVVFRWFNRISTGEAIFCQPDMFDGETAFDRLVQTGDVDCLGRAIRSLIPSGPYVTGAYTINTNTTPLGTPKLDGVLQIIQKWVETHPDWRQVAALMLQHEWGQGTLREFCEWCRSPNLGPFMTYEVACDLAHTGLLMNAPDLDTWANLGPGARRGLNRIHRGLSGRAADAAVDNEQALAEMAQLLRASWDVRYWPQKHRAGWKSDQDMDQVLVRGDWPRWRMREVEHTLCEFDKYERVRKGEGTTRGKFNGSH